MHFLEYEIHSGALRVQVDALGAQIKRIRDNTGHAWLWHGDGKFWSETAPTLFPFVGRHFDDRYIYNGRAYPMGLHGFSRDMPFSCARRGENTLVLTLTDTEKTRAVYPFSFSFTVEYTVCKDRLRARYIVRNVGATPMYFCVGGHPGFTLPMDKNLRFEDYFLRFFGNAAPVLVEIVPKCMVTGKRRAVPLDRGRLFLSRALFTRGACVFENGENSVRLESARGGRAIEMFFPNMRYFAVWQAENAPFLCLEPWSGRPGAHDFSEDIARRDGLTQLNGGEIWRGGFCVRFVGAR